MVNALRDARSDLALNANLAYTRPSFANWQDILSALLDDIPACAFSLFA